MLKHPSIPFGRHPVAVAAVAASLASAIAGSLAMGQVTGESSGAQQLAIYCQTVGGELACGDLGDREWRLGAKL